MTLSIGELNQLLPDQAARQFRGCCGSSRWVGAMVAGRPYPSRQALLAAAESAWQEAGPADWDEALRHHPRIGERTGHPRSRAEQRGALHAGRATRRALARGNRQYEQRFGRIYLVCAEGKTGSQILADLEARLGNDPETERRAAAAELGKILRLRLAALVREEAESRTGGYGEPGSLP